MSVASNRGRFKDGNGLRLVTWNVNGLRAIAKKFGGVAKLLDSLEADIVCIQETKLTKSELDRELALVDDWESFFSFCMSKTGYSGVATFCRTEVALPILCENGVTGAEVNSGVGCSDCLHGSFDLHELEELDSEGRCVITDHRHFVLFNIYAPALTSEENFEERVAFKMRWYKALKLRTEALIKSGRNVVIVGDFNIAPCPIDSCRCQNVAEFSGRDDRKLLRGMLALEGGPFFDLFRHRHPHRKEAYTCWNVATGARTNNYGSRIDLILAGPGATTENNDFIGAVKDVDIWSDMHGSDHAPVFVDLEIETPLVRNCLIPPPGSSRFLFTGKQVRIDDWMLAKCVSREQQHATTSKTEFTPRNNGLNTSVTSGLGNGDAIATYNCGTLKQTMGQQKRSGGDFKSGLPISIQKKKRKKVQMDMRLFVQNKRPTKTKRTLAVTDERTGVNDVVCPVNRVNGLNNVVDVDSNVNLNINMNQTNVGCSMTDTSTSSDRDVSISNTSKEDSVFAWKKIYDRMKPPLCQGHGEACVIRTVKKQGENKGRLFYVCARPDGKKPEGRCNHFEWADRRKVPGQDDGRKRNR